MPTLSFRMEKEELTEEDEKRILKRWENSKSEKTASAEEVFKRLEL